jgi:hypothetical protein
LKIRVLYPLLVVLLCLASLLLPVPARAAAGISGFHNVTLWLYPEYDNQSLLVMLEGKVAASEVPSQVKFLVPHNAVMYSAGSKDAQGNYSGGPPNRIASQISGWDEISYQLNTETFRVEYYSDIILGTTQKTFAYDFRWLYPISDLTVIAQHPLIASNYTISPPGTAGTEGQFAVSTFQFTNPDINQPLHFDIAYTKTDPNPSIGNAANTPASSNSVSTGNLTLIVIGALVVVSVIAFLIVNRLKKKKPSRISRSQSRSPAKPTKAAEKYCDQCGQPLNKNYKFCPHCGNNLE